MGRAAVDLREKSGWDLAAVRGSEGILGTERGMGSKEEKREKKKEGREEGRGRGSL